MISTGLRTRRPGCLSSRMRSLRMSGAFMLLASLTTIHGEWEKIPMSSDLELQAQFRVGDNASLEFDAWIRNTARTTAFILNGLWNLDASSQLVPDPEKAYRFVDGDNRLVILIGIPWLPRSSTPVYQNVPYASTIASGESVHFAVSIPMPVKEYNPYFPEQPDASYETVETTEVKLVLHYVAYRPEFEVEPSRFLAGFANLPPEALEHVVAVESVAQPLALEVWKRIDEEFERPTESITVR